MRASTARPSAKTKLGGEIHTARGRVRFCGGFLRGFMSGGNNPPQRKWMIVLKGIQDRSQAALQTDLLTACLCQHHIADTSSGAQRRRPQKPPSGRIGRLASESNNNQRERRPRRRYDRQHSTDHQTKTGRCFLLGRIRGWGGLKITISRTTTSKSTM